MRAPVHDLPLHVAHEVMHAIRALLGCRLDIAYDASTNRFRDTETEVSLTREETR